MGSSGRATVPVRSEPTQPLLPSVSPIRLVPSETMASAGVGPAGGGRVPRHDRVGDGQGGAGVTRNAAARGGAVVGNCVIHGRELAWKTRMPPPRVAVLLSAIVLLVIVSAPVYTAMPPPPTEPAELSLKVQPEIEP